MFIFNFRYAIPPSNGHRFERLAAGFFPLNSKKCPGFLRHKEVVISPYVLKNNGISFDKVSNY